MMVVAPSTLKTNTPVSNGRKSRDRGAPTAPAATTQKGMTKRVICVADPTATPMESSILFFIAKMTAEACSAALPTMGSKMVDTKATGSCSASAATSIVSTTRSDSQAIHSVRNANQKIDPRKPSTSSSSSSPSSSPSSSSLPASAAGAVLYSPWSLRKPCSGAVARVDDPPPPPPLLPAAAGGLCGLSGSKRKRCVLSWKTRNAA
mmetsp:Transcript_31274/g.73878  ORF Transcript_31274/g.73878 Transcript_31274/m.73878 type:complete len:206 (+) Transcript_31274:344-961(+)